MSKGSDEFKSAKDSESTDVDEEYTGVPQQIRMFERKLERHFEPTEDGYRDSEIEGYYRCKACNSPIYYSRRKPEDLAKHLSSCEGTSGRPDFN